MADKIVLEQLQEIVAKLSEGYDHAKELEKTFFELGEKLTKLVELYERKD